MLCICVEGCLYPSEALGGRMQAGGQDARVLGCLVQQLPGLCAVWSGSHGALYAYL